MLKEAKVSEFECELLRTVKNGCVLIVGGVPKPLDFGTPCHQFYQLIPSFKLLICSSNSSHN